MAGFDFLKSASDDSEVAFNSAAWEGNYNCKRQFCISGLRKLEGDFGGGVGWVCGWIVGENMMAALSYGVN